MRWRENTPRRERAQETGRTWLAGWRRLGERVRRIARTGQRAAPPPEPRQWGDRLTEEKDFLVALVRGMETEFLATGEGLQRLAQQLSEIQQECQLLTELTVGQGQDTAAQFAFQLLKKAEDLVLASYDQYDHLFAGFGELRQRLGQLSKQHEELRRSLLPLNFITSAFRLEASRHPAEVREAFVMLATHVKQTVEEVRGTLERQFEELAASEGIARHLLDQVSNSVQQHRQEVHATLTMTRNHLGALSEALGSSGAGAAELAHLSQSVTGAIGGIVLAQQCQDMTRQKIDRVGAAMEAMRARLDKAPPAGAAADPETRRFIRQAAETQLGQARNVFDELLRAAHALEAGLRSLRTEAVAATAAAVRVGGTTLDAHVASQSQASIGELLAIVKQAVRKIADLLAAFEPLQARFVACTTKATELARDVCHAALNAQVFAAHARDGATLEVLAERGRVISAEAIQRVEALGGALRETAEMVTQLGQRLADFQHLGQAEQKVLSEEAALSQRKLSEVEDAIPVLIQRITREQASFANAVAQVLANVRFPGVVAAARSRSLGFFRDLATWGGAAEAGARAGSAGFPNDPRLEFRGTPEVEQPAGTAFRPPTPAPADMAPPALEPRTLLAAGSADADDRGDRAPPREGSAPPPRPPERPPGETTPPAPAVALAAAKPAPGEPLGDNVELF